MIRFTKIGPCLIVLALFIPLSWKAASVDPADINPRRPWELRKPDTSIELPAMIIPRPMGPGNAPARIWGLRDRKVGLRYQHNPIGAQYRVPVRGQVRAEFVDMSAELGATEAAQAKVSCKSGVTINGQNQFRLPKKSNRLVMLNGPVGQHDYAPKDLEEIVVPILKTSPPSPRADEKPKGSGAKH